MNNSNLPPQGILPDPNVKKPRSKWWIGVLIALAIVGYNSSRPTRTAKDLAREASGQQAVPSDASDAEKRAITVIAQTLTVRKEMDARDGSFKQTFTGQHLLEPETLSSPEVAAQSLGEIKDYCGAQKEYIGQFRQLMIQAEQIDGKPVDFSWVNNQFDAALVWCSAAEDLYQYASDPARNVQVINGKVFITGAEGYNKRIRIVNDAAKNLSAAGHAFDAAQDKSRRENGTTPQDYGLKEEK